MRKQPRRAPRLSRPRTARRKPGVAAGPVPQRTPRCGPRHGLRAKQLADCQLRSRRGVPGLSRVSRVVSEYPCHRPAQLISATAYPTFQACSGSPYRATVSAATARFDVRPRVSRARSARQGGCHAPGDHHWFDEHHAQRPVCPVAERQLLRSRQPRLRRQPHSTLGPL